MFNKFRDIIQDQNGKIGIFLHHNADPDAVCSAESVGQLVSNINAKLGYKIFSDGINISAKRVAQAQNVVIYDNNDLEGIQLAISVDTGNASQLGKYESVFTDKKIPFIVIDHHASNEMKNLTLHSVYDESSPSTCMIISKLYEQLGLTPDPRVATLLICGHLYDSRRFIHGATSNIFRLMAALIDAGGDYNAANEYLQNDMSLGEKIARLKAARRLQYLVIKDKIIVVSQVSSFESSSARSLISYGCDIVFVIAKQKDETRGSARATNDIGLNVGDILTNLAQELTVSFNKEDEETSYSGGGHKNAAGINFKPALSNSQIKKLSNRFFEVVSGLLNGNGGTSSEESKYDELDDIEIIS